MNTKARCFATAPREAWNICHCSLQHKSKFTRRRYELMEITVIGNASTGWAGVVNWAAGATRTGEIYVDDAGDMVSKVLKAAGSQNISRLNILDHEIKTRTKIKTGVVKSIGIDIGKDVINEYNVGSFKSLSTLKGHFTQDGFVHLQHCYIGIN